MSDADSDPGSKPEVDDESESGGGGEGDKVLNTKASFPSNNLT
jgi:hypothetical protein